MEQNHKAKRPLVGGKIVCSNFKMADGSLAFWGSTEGHAPAACKLWQCPECGRSRVRNMLAGIVDGWWRVWPEHQPWMLTLTFASRAYLPSGVLETWDAFIDRRGVNLQSLPEPPFDGKAETRMFRWMQSVSQSPLYFCSMLRCPPFRHNHHVTAMRRGWGADGWQPYIRECWRRFTIAFQRKYQFKLEFLRVQEFTEQGVPHLHVILPSLDTWAGVSSDQFQQWAAGQWLKLTGDSWQVDVLTPRHAGHAIDLISYPLKYITKDYFNTDIPWWPVAKRWLASHSFPKDTAAAPGSVWTRDGEWFNRKKWGRILTAWRTMRDKGELPPPTDKSHATRNRMKGFPDCRAIQAAYLRGDVKTDAEIRLMAQRLLDSMYAVTFWTKPQRVLIDRWLELVLVYARRPLMAWWRPYLPGDDPSPFFGSAILPFGRHVAVDREGEPVLGKRDIGCDLGVD